MEKVLRVLLIEDSESDAALILRELKKSNFMILESRVVETSEDVSNALTESTWNLIISDFSLPQMDAFDVLKIVKESGLDIPFILISGLVGEDIAVSLMRAGVNDYLMKDNLKKLEVIVTRELTDADNRRERREAEDRLARAVEGSNFGLWDWDMTTHLFNPSKNFKQLLGYAEEELNDHEDLIFDLCHPNDLQGMKDSIRLSKEEGSPINLTARLRNKNDHYKWFLVRGKVKRDRTGKPSKIAGAISDVDDLRQLQTELKQNIKKLAESNESLKQFAHVVSHDLQEPLRMIANYINLLEKNFGESLDEKIRSYIHFVSDGAYRMKLLIVGLLKYSKLESKDIDMEVVDMQKVFERVHNIFKNDLDLKKGTFTAGELPSIKANTILIEDSLINLVSNALKFNKSEAPAIDFQAIEEPHQWIFSLSDNGVGIEKQYFEKIFELFKRAGSTIHPDGHGLGLAICKRIIEKHGGKIWLTSSPGKGSTFFFSLPKE